MELQRPRHTASSDAGEMARPNHSGAHAAEPRTAPTGIELVTEGDVLYAAMLASIRDARRSVCMESHLFANDEVGREFAAALAEPALAGVEVRLHLDAAGALGFGSAAVEQHLRGCGVAVKRFHRWSWRQPLRYNRRNHRKLLVVDGRLAYVGGFNIHRQSSRRFHGKTGWFLPCVSQGSARSSSGNFMPTSASRPQSNPGTGPSGAGAALAGDCRLNGA